MNRAQLIAEKQDEIRQHLRQWNLEHGLLETGEFLSFSLSIGRIEDCVIPVIQPDDVAVNRNSWSFDLNEEDWNFLLDCNFDRGIYKEFISLLRTRKNEPVRIPEAKEVLGAELAALIGQRFHHSMNRALNYYAHHAKYQYSFSSGGTGGKVPERKFRLAKRLKN